MTIGPFELDTVVNMDCLEGMSMMEPDSVDAIITDPPYGIGFMGKEWDNFNPQKIDEAMAKDKRKHTGIASQRRSNTAGTYDLSLTGNKKFQNWCYRWAVEALRVAKPGGYLLAFGGTRTYHRLVCAIEDAGWEIRDMIEWVYGSGFPKSLDVSKAIDKAAGAQGEEVDYLAPDGKKRWGGNTFSVGNPPDGRGVNKRTLPTTDAARQWEGWGTALKPAHEPICLARKPLGESTVAANVLRWGCGGLNIDKCRVGYNGEKPNIGGRGAHGRGDGYGFLPLGDGAVPNQTGRFPANLIHDGSDEVLAVFPNSKSTIDKSNHAGREGTSTFAGNRQVERVQRGDSGSAARFFKCCPIDDPNDETVKSMIYVPKASKADRDEGCGGMEEQMVHRMGHGNNEPDGRTQSFITHSKNSHPCVKPYNLMRYLCRLITPPCGIIFDPFAGSGSTGKAAIAEGFHFISFEIDAHYCAIANKRINIERAQLRLAL